MKTHALTAWRPAVLAVLIVWMAGSSIAVVASPPDYDQREGGIVLRRVGPENPLVYDNDWWRDIPDAAYLWAKASLGQAQLKGNIVSRDMWDWQNGYQYKLDDGIMDALALFDAAEKSGLRHIPRPIAGADAALVRPESGDIADTRFSPSAGSDLIVREARKTTPDRPLLIFCGGPCTTVATAYLTDPSIATRVIVFQVDGGGYNGKDSWSWEIAQQKLPFVNWADGYFWGAWSRWKPEQFDRLPMNSLNKSLRDYAHSDLGKANQWGDGAWIFGLFELRCITRVKTYKNVGLTVPQEGTDIQRIEDEFFATMSDPRVYQAAPAPQKKASP